MTDNGRELACACAPELLVELWEAADWVADAQYRGRFVNAIQASRQIIEELRAGRIKLVLVEAVHDA